MKRPYAEALALANEFIQKFVKGEVAIAGSIRRKEAMAGDVDIMTTEALDKIEQRLEFSYVFSHQIKKIRGGEKKLDIDFKKMRFNIYHAEPAYWGSMLFFLTGPSRYGIAYRVKAKKMGGCLNQYGLFNNYGEVVAAKTEAAIYKAFGKPYKEPEFRGK